MEYDFESMQEITEREKALNKERRQEHLKAVNLAKEEDQKFLKKEKEKLNKQLISKLENISKILWKMLMI